MGWYGWVANKVGGLGGVFAGREGVGRIGCVAYAVCVLDRCVSEGVGGLCVYPCAAGEQHCLCVMVLVLCSQKSCKDSKYRTAAFQKYQPNITTYSPLSIAIILSFLSPQSVTQPPIPHHHLYPASLSAAA